MGCSDSCPSLTRTSVTHIPLINAVRLTRLMPRRASMNLWPRESGILERAVCDALRRFPRWMSRRRNRSVHHQLARSSVATAELASRPTQRSVRHAERRSDRPRACEVHNARGNTDVADVQTGFPSPPASGRGARASIGGIGCITALIEACNDSRQTNEAVACLLAVSRT